MGLDGSPAWYTDRRRGSTKQTDPITALYDFLALWNYRFQCTFGLTVMTTGEKFVIYILAAALLGATSWLSVRLAQYLFYAATSLLLTSTEAPASGVAAGMVKLTSPLQTAYRQMATMDLMALQVYPEGGLTTLAGLRRNASMAFAP